jgi:hypothetical protein
LREEKEEGETAKVLVVERVLFVAFSAPSQWLTLL